MNYGNIRDDIREDLDLWGSGNQPYPPGGFLRAVLENDLAGAFGRADDDNRRAMHDIVCYVYNELPSQCWGSPAKVAAWLTQAQQRAGIEVGNV